MEPKKFHSNKTWYTAARAKHNYWTKYKSSKNFAKKMNINKSVMMHVKFNKRTPNGYHNIN